MYEVADQFRRRCLAGSLSLLWPERPAWAPETLSSLLKAYLGHPDEGERSFFAKCRDQLVGQPEEVL